MAPLALRLRAFVPNGVPPSRFVSRPDRSRLPRFRESVHAGVPLQGDDGAFDRLQQAERHDQARRDPQREVRGQSGRVFLLDQEHQRDEHVPDDQDYQVRREVVGAVVELFAAGGPSEAATSTPARP